MATHPHNDRTVVCNKRLQRALSWLNIDASQATTREAKVKLLLDFIKRSNDLMVIYDVMDIMEISCQGATTIEETKERIEIGLSKVKIKQDNYFEQLKSQLERKKSELGILYDEFLKILNNTLPSMKDRISSEDILGMGTNIEEMKETLRNAKYTLVVSGETGSGKSTLLNVILNDMLLPHHALSCTSTICIIKYGEKKRMKMNYYNGHTHLVDIEDNEQSKLKLKEALFKRSERENGSDIRSCGLVLVDTPGIGENEAMEKILTNFINENEIQGFIYVIKVDGAACGIQEDRILKLMNIVLEKQKSVYQSSVDSRLFDPATALFVFNRWDLIADEDKENVADFVNKRLKRFSSDIDKSEVIFMSATSVIRQKENGFISPSYGELMNGIKNIIEETSTAILKRFYKWLNYMVSRSHHHCKTLFSAADFSEFQKRQWFEKTKEKMDILEKSSAEIFQKLRLTIDEKEKILNKTLESYIRSEDALAKIVSLTNVEIEFARSNIDTNGALCDMIDRRIIDAISEETSIDQEMKKFNEILIKNIKKDTFLLQEELTSIESEMNEDVSCPILPPDKRRTSNVSVCSMQLPLVPPKISSSIIVKLTLSAKNLLKKHTLNELSTTKKVIKKLCKERIEHFLKESNYIECQFEPIRRYLDKVETNIPQLIESNKSLVRELNKIRSLHVVEKQTYTQVLDKITDLQDKIVNYSIEHCFNRKIRRETSSNISSCSSEDFESINNSIVDSGIVADYKRRIPKSLFTQMIPGTLSEVEITIRKYFDQSNIQHHLREIEKIAQLSHKCVARYLKTISANEEPLPMILFEERLFSLRYRTSSFKKRSLINKDDYFVYIENIVSGLSYLHTNGMVHPEVSLDNVMVNWHQEVKLIGMALPRKIPIADYDHPIRDMIYLAPEVLRGGKYIPPSDVFGLGLLICELFIKNKVFAEESKLSVTKFLKTVNTSKVKYFELIPDRFQILVSKMLREDPESRITSAEVLNSLSN
ncbi:uncharacterized protein LOC115216741 [Argonauta hians]